MEVAELVRRSPVRALERGRRGGLRPGECGVLAGPRGVGKTACLVHLAIDRLLQQQRVIHVSFAADTTHVAAWYDDIFQELAHRYQIDGAMQAHESIIPNRVLANFSAGNGCWERVQRTIAALADSGGFRARTVVVDGYRFPAAELDAFRRFRQFAVAMGLEVWMSATAEKPDTAGAACAVPAALGPFADECAVVIVLENRGTYIHLGVARGRDTTPAESRLRLDPHFLLMAEEN